MKQALAVSAYNMRVDSLKREGYAITFETHDDGLYFTKLVHGNGNRVDVRFSLKDGYLSQSTNGQTVFSDKVY